MTHVKRILGLDPGLRYTGWAVIEAYEDNMRYIDDGTLKTEPSHRLSQRLAFLYINVSKLVERYHPDEVSIEKVFVNQNGVSTLKLGQARGVIMSAPAVYSLNIWEYSPKTIKKALVGTGAANKDQVEMMVRQIFPEAKMKRSDASDALAIAICHAHHQMSQRLLKLYDHVDDPYLI